MLGAVLDIPYTITVDWWALGILIYEMLTAQQVFNVCTLSSHSPPSSRMGLNVIWAVGGERGAAV